MDTNTTPLRHVLGIRVDATTYKDIVGLIREWARRKQSRYICCGTVNHIIVAQDDREFRRTVNRADVVTPDGVPLVWALRLHGVRGATRVYGPDLTLELLGLASREKIAVGLYGGTPHTLGLFSDTVRKRYPRLNVAFAYAPPFSPLTPAEDKEIVERINESGARILFVGLGTPKQDRWMGEHRGRIKAVMLGVGAAFDFHAGTKPQAPRWMMRLGLEWLFRLCSEPRRLWRRYVFQNPRFIALFALQLLGLRRFSSESPDENQL